MGTETLSLGTLHPLLRRLQLQQQQQLPQHDAGEALETPPEAASELLLMEPPPWPQQLQLQQQQRPQCPGSHEVA